MVHYWIMIITRVQVKRAIIESSRQTLLATDHSKFSRQAIVRLGELKDVDYLFTDDVPKTNCGVFRK